MNSIINNLTKSFAFAVILYFFQCLLEIKYLGDFFRSNLVTILMTVLAINTATTAVLLSKMGEICQQYNKSINEIFGKTKKQLKLSIQEQIAAVIAALILSMLTANSSLINNTTLNATLEVFLITTFFYGIALLYDTAVAVLNFYD